MFRDPVEELEIAVDVLCGSDPEDLAHGDIVRRLYLQLERLNALTTHAAAAFDAGGEWEADSARSAAAWIAARCRVPVATARRRVRLGRCLRAMPATDKAWLAGDISETHVEVLASVRARVGSECFDPDEGQLVGYAREFPYRHFLRALAYWEQVVDPDGAEEDAKSKHEARRLHLSQSFEGMWFCDGVFDSISGDIVARTLKTIEDELFQADWAEAQARVDHEVCVSDLVRTPAQRRVDALVEMARRAGAKPPGARMPEPLFTVLVGYETFKGRICELAGGTVVTPGSLVPWLSQAWVERVVFDGPDRVKNVGVRRRVFAGATRRAVEVRDRECFSEFCDLPAEDCEIDHVEPYAEGGPTIDANGRPACGYHNRARHRRRG